MIDEKVAAVVPGQSQRMCGRGYFEIDQVRCLQRLCDHRTADEIAFGLFAGLNLEGHDLVVKLAERQEELLADREKMTEVKGGGEAQQALLKDKEIARCKNELAVLGQNNQDLEQTIARLKKLLIEMESRSN